MVRFASFVSLALLAAAPTAHAQQRVQERDLLGTWQLILDLDADEAETATERIILKSIGGLLDEVDVRFEFRPDGELHVRTVAFGETDTDTSDWTITEDGALLIGDTGDLDIETDGDVWMLAEPGVLRSYTRTEDGLVLEEEASLKKLK